MPLTFFHPPVVLIYKPASNSVEKASISNAVAHAAHAVAHGHHPTDARAAGEQVRRSFDMRRVVLSLVDSDLACGGDACSRGGESANPPPPKDHTGDRTKGPASVP